MRTPIRVSLVAGAALASLALAQGIPAPLSWAPVTPLAQPRDHHVTFHTTGTGGNFLWVAGGNDYRRAFRDVVYARVSDDGALGEWTAADSLPVERAGPAVAVTGQYVFISGGQNARQNVTDVYVSTIAADGRLGPWRTTLSLPAPRFHHSMVAAGRFVYVIGGLEATTSVNVVWRGAIGPDGGITRWDTLPALPTARSHHGIAVHTGAIYLVGGLDGNPAGANTPLRSVLRARIQPDGGLGHWEELTATPNAYATHAATVHGGFIWTFGGVEDNARFVDVVLRAPVAADGTLGAWEPVTPGLPNARSHVHQVPVINGRAYSVSGSNARRLTPDVYVGTFGGSSR
jgi:hypothetical protein